MKKRKLWSTTLMGSPARTSHESRAAAYRYLKELRRHRSTENAIVDVWVNDRQYQDWQLYERVDLAEYGAWDG